MPISKVCHIAFECDITTVAQVDFLIRNNYEGNYASVGELIAKLVDDAAKASGKYEESKEVVIQIQR